MHTVYPKKYAHSFVVLCFVVVMQSFIMNSHEVFIHINQGCFAGTGTFVRLPQCQWSKPDGYGKISKCITTTKHSKAVTVCIFLGMYCIFAPMWWQVDIAFAMGEWNIQQIIRQYVICYNTRYRYDYDERNTQKQKICHTGLCYVKNCYVIYNYFISREITRLG